MNTINKEINNPSLKITIYNEENKDDIIKKVNILIERFGLEIVELPNEFLDIATGFRVKEYTIKSK